jgi:predicted HAD superfamily Cof-like phosphohydrolase
MNAHLKSRNQLLVELFMAHCHAHPVGLNMHALPVSPSIPSLEARKLSARLMLEECMETIQKGLGLDIVDVHGALDFGRLGFEEKCTPNLVEVADGLADQEVVNLGTAARCGLAHQPIFEIVAQNNLLKFAEGHRFNAVGKLIKPPNHPVPTGLIVDSLLRQGASPSLLR